MTLDINYTTTNPRNVDKILEAAVEDLQAGAVSVAGASPPVMTLPDASTVQVVKSYTWAGLPAASAYIGVAVVSDIGGGSYWASNGSTWYPLGNRITLYDMPASNAQLCGTEKIMAQLSIPAGLLKNRDKLRVTYTYTKSSTVETATHNFRLGTAGTVADTGIAATTAPGGTSVVVGNIIEFQRASATTLQRLGGSVTGGYNGPSTTALPAPVTVANMDTNPLFLSLTSVSSANAETYTLVDYRVELITKGA
jgi:hypothetical protein